MATKYNPIEDNFYTYEAAETPKVTLNLPLNNFDTDISDWSIGFAKTEDGEENTIKTPLAKGTKLGRAIFSNNETPNPVSQQQLSSKQEVPTNQSVKLTETSPLLRAKEFFVKKGLSPYIAAGIVGNLIHESGLDTTAVGDNGSAYGLALWRLDRRKNLGKFAKERGKDISDFDTLLEFLWHELNTGYKKVLDKLLGSKDATQATDIFMRDYERPNLKYANFKRRVAYALSLI